MQVGTWDQAIFEEGRTAGRMGVPESLNPYRRALEAKMTKGDDRYEYLRPQSHQWALGWDKGTHQRATLTGKEG